MECGTYDIVVQVAEVIAASNCSLGE